MVTKYIDEKLKQSDLRKPLKCFKTLITNKKQKTVQKNTAFIRICKTYNMCFRSMVQ